MRKIILGMAAFTACVGVFVYLPTAYVNERCGQVGNWLAQKSKDPELYPGLRHTAELKKTCPSIKSDIVPVVSRASLGVKTNYHDAWKDIEDFQREMFALQAAKGDASQ